MCHHPTEVSGGKPVIISFKWWCSWCRWSRCPALCWSRAWCRLGCWSPRPRAGGGAPRTCGPPLKQGGGVKLRRRKVHQWWDDTGDSTQLVICWSLIAPAASTALYLAAASRSRWTWSWWPPACGSPGSRWLHWPPRSCPRQLSSWHHDKLPALATAARYPDIEADTAAANICVLAQPTIWCNPGQGWQWPVSGSWHLYNGLQMVRCLK